MKVNIRQGIHTWYSNKMVTYKNTFIREALTVLEVPRISRINNYASFKESQKSRLYFIKF